MLFGDCCYADSSPCCTWTITFTIVFDNSLNIIKVDVFLLVFITVNAQQRGVQCLILSGIFGGRTGQQVAAACSTSLTCLTKKCKGSRRQYNVVRPIRPSQLSGQDVDHQFQTPIDCSEGSYFIFILTTYLYLLFSVNTLFLND